MLFRERACQGRRGVGQAREQELRQMIRDFQNEADADTSQRQWKQIEKEIFGVDYHDGLLERRGYRI